MQILTTYLNDRILPLYVKSKTEDFVIVEDNSALSIWENCNRKFLYRVLLSLQEKDERVSLTFGVAFHKFLELYHAGDFTFQECFEAFCTSAFKKNSKIATTRQVALDNNLLQEYSAEFGYILCKKYMQQHPLDKEYFTILRDSENKPYTETGFALDLPNGIVIGLIDGIGKINTTNKIVVIDHKTTKSQLNNSWKSSFNPNNQMSKYLSAASEYFGQRINTAIINGIRVKDYKRGDPKENAEKLFDRVETERTDAQLEQHMRHVNFQLGQIKQSINIGVDGFPMETNSCNGKYGECEYKRLCLAKDDYVIQLLAEGSYREEAWHPYEIFEESETKKIVEIGIKDLGELLNKPKVELLDKEFYLKNKINVDDAQ